MEMMKNQFSLDYTFLNSLAIYTVYHHLCDKIQYVIPKANKNINIIKFVGFKTLFMKLTDPILSRIFKQGM